MGEEVRKPRPERDEHRMRTCLRCDRLFLSESPAHRRCKSCHAILEPLPTPEPVYSMRWPY